MLLFNFEKIFRIFAKRVNKIYYAMIDSTYVKAQSTVAGMVCNGSGCSGMKDQVFNHNELDIQRLIMSRMLMRKKQDAEFF